MPTVTTRTIDKLKIVKALDPRLNERNEDKIRDYANNLDNLPPIEIDQDDRILDGVHRYLAHKQAGRDEIHVKVFTYENDADAAEHAIRSNVAHGVPLTPEEIKQACIRLCESGLSNRKIAKIVKRQESVVGKHVKETRARIENELADKLGKLYEIRDENDKRIYTHDKLKAEIGQSEKRVATLLDCYFANEMTELLESQDLTDEELIEKFDITPQRMKRINKKFGDMLRPPAPEPEPEDKPEDAVEEVDEEVVETVTEEETTTEPEPQTAAEAKSAVDEDGDESKRTHKEMQWMLLWLGNELNLNLWLPKADLTQSHKKKEITNLAGKLEDLPFDILKEGRSVQRIDVIWLWDNKIIAAFEIENSTGIESGLFRMSHMWVSMNDSSIRTHIVAPDNDINRVRDKISEPTFKHNGLAGSCWFIPYTGLTKLFNEAERNGSFSNNWQELLDEIGHKL